MEVNLTPFFLIDRQRPQRAAEAGQHQVGNHTRTEHREAGEGQRRGRVPETRVGGELTEMAEPPDAHPGDGQGKALTPARPTGGARAHRFLGHVQAQWETGASSPKRSRRTFFGEVNLTPFSRDSNRNIL